MHKRKLELIIAGIVILVTVASIIFISAKNTREFVYEGEKGNIKFTTQQIGSVKFFMPHVFVDGREHIYNFRNKPHDLEDIPLEANLIYKLNRPGGIKDLFITKDINLSDQIGGKVSISIAPLLSILGRSDSGIYRVRITNTYTDHNPGDPIASVVDCSTVNLNTKINKTIAVIYLKLEDENRIYSDGDCIVIEGKNTDGLIKSGEKFAYHLIGIF